MSKSEELFKIKQEMEADASLPLRAGANLVFGKGNPDTDLMFIGEAPGRTEDKLKEPFVGRAGKLLDKMFEEIKMPREKFYISNIVKHRPPENRDPLPHEIEAYKPYLKREVQIIKPKIIAPLGRFAMNYFLPNEKISSAHGKLFKIQDILIYPLYHPAAALRATGILENLEKDFKKLPSIIKNYKILIEKTDRSQAKETKDKSKEDTNSEKQMQKSLF